MKKFLLTLTAVVALTAASRIMVVSAQEMAANAPEAMTNEVAMNNEAMNNEAMNNETMNNEAMNNETNAVVNEAENAAENTGASSEGMTK